MEPSSAADNLYSVAAMTSAYANEAAAFEALDAKLRRRGAPWLFGGEVTMADLFWGVELLRLKNVGASEFWHGDRLPEVTRFVAAAERLPAIRTAILGWPGALC